MLGGGLERTQKEFEKFSKADAAALPAYYAALEMVADVLREIDAVAARRKVPAHVRKTHEADSVPCAPWLQQQLRKSVQDAGLPLRELPSGAGHDAMAMAAVADVAMLFVRCGNGGISHHPAEIMSAEDAALAACVFSAFVENFQESHDREFSGRPRQARGGHHRFPRHPAERAAREPIVDAEVSLGLSF